MQITTKRGRPVEVDPGRVARVALRLFEKRGLDAVTMDEIADAAKISRRTLFRLFPTKGDLLWGELEQVLRMTQQRIKALGMRRVALSELLEEVLVPTLTLFEEKQWAGLARRRLKLIIASPSLLSNRVLDELKRVFAESLTNNVDALKQPPSLVAECIVAIGFASILWWARSRPGASPATAFRDAMAAMAEAGQRAVLTQS